MIRERKEEIAREEVQNNDAENSEEISNKLQTPGFSQLINYFTL